MTNSIAKVDLLCSDLTMDLIFGQIDHYEIILVTQ